MNNDVITFLIGLTVLIAYLIFSAKTEMGTKLFRKRKKKVNQKKSLPLG
jgi:hypothetical protein